MTEEIKIFGIDLRHTFYEACAKDGYSLKKLNVTLSNKYGGKIIPVSEMIKDNTKNKIKEVKLNCKNTRTFLQGIFDVAKYSVKLEMQQYLFKHLGTGHVVAFKDDEGASRFVENILSDPFLKENVSGLNFSIDQAYGPDARQIIALRLQG
jgi:hypothetical protein